MYDNGVKLYATQNIGLDGDGVCAAMSMGYCHDILRGKQPAMTRRIGKQRDLIDSYQMESEAVQTARKEMVIRNNGLKELPEWNYQTQHLAEIYRLRSTSNRSYPGRGLIQYIARIPLGQVWYIRHTQRVRGRGPSGHAVAASRAMNGDLYFLDPNHGLYHYQNPNLIERDLLLEFGAVINAIWSRSVMQAIH